MLIFRCLARSGLARAGVITTRHGEVPTPAFMPVGTRATIKSLSPEEVAATGARMVIMNTYHLLVRPGPEVIRSHGGLHGFSRWRHVIATDSGGFQAYSLAARTKLTADGFEFSSHLDGRRIALSPEESMRVQAALDSDIAMQLDVCPAAGASAAELGRAIERTTEWAVRCLDARSPEQALFGIVQGGTNVELRLAHACALDPMPFDGLALGGFSVGEPRAEMFRALAAVTPRLDTCRPRYLMGVGTPRDLVEAIGLGVDLFDCVLPTRNSRNGQVFVPGGKLAIKNARFRADLAPLDAACACPACAGGYSRAYLRHLYLGGEILGIRLLTLHNVAYYQRLVAEARAAVLKGDYAAWAEAELRRLTAGHGGCGDAEGARESTST
jgi:queuine tRNA-ribosyltransferase